MNETSLSPDKIEVLRDLDGVLSDFQIPFMLIGASCRVLRFDMRYGIENLRRTNDVDIAATVDTWERYMEIHHALSDKSGGLFAEDDRIIHRLIHKNGCLLDLIPFGGVESSDSRIEWPDREDTLSVEGFEIALSQSEELAISAGLVIPVLTLQCLVMLKLFSWNDRKNERERDLEDLVSIVSLFPDDESIFDDPDAVDFLTEAEFDYSLHGCPLALGLSIGDHLPAEECEKMMTVIGEIVENADTHLADHVRNRFDPEVYERGRMELAGRFSALRKGISLKMKLDRPSSGSREK
jgi:predicted nucleotidyltransferase